MPANYTVNMVQAMAPVAQIVPASQSAGSVLTTPAIDMSNVRRVLAVVQTGVMQAGSTVDFKFQASATAGGSYTDLDATNCKITQITQAGDTGSIIAELELKAESMAGTGLRYVKGLLTVGTAATLVGVVVYGTVGRNGPESLYGLTTKAPVVY